MRRAQPWELPQEGLVEELLDAAGAEEGEGAERGVTEGTAGEGLVRAVGEGGVVGGRGRGGGVA